MDFLHPEFIYSIDELDFDVEYFAIMTDITFKIEKDEKRFLFFIDYINHNIIGQTTYTFVLLQRQTLVILK